MEYSVEEYILGNTCARYVFTNGKVFLNLLPVVVSDKPTENFVRYEVDNQFADHIDWYSGWSKTVKPGDSFKAPKACIAAIKGDIADLADVMLRARESNIEEYGNELIL